MNGQKKRANITRRSKRRSEPSRLTAGMRLEIGSSINRRGFNAKTSIWETLEEAKKKQERIRNRVRKYGQEDDDSDYNDSPSYDAPSHDTPSCDGNTNLQVHEEVDSNSESDSEECDDEFNSEPPLNDTEEKDKNRALPRSFSSPLPEKDFSASRSGNIQNHRLQINSKTSMNSKTIVNNLYNFDSQTQQSQTRIKYPARKNSLSARRGEKLPVLTPEEAIRLVMERHSYISDSERTEEDHPLPTRKFSKGSSSTNETAINTVNSDSGHNRTPEGKRVLVLRKKLREDTHPHTSKNKHSQKSSCEGTHCQPSQQNKNEQFYQRKKQEQQQDSSNSQFSISKKNDKIQAEVKTSIGITTKPDLSPSLKLLSRLREQAIAQENEENKSHSNSQRKQEQKNTVERNDSRLRDKHDIVEEVNNDYLDDKEAHIANQHQSMKHRCHDAVIADEKLLQQALPPAENEAIIEKEIVLLNDNNDSQWSDSESDVYNEDYLSTDNGYVQLSIDPSKKLECINVAIDENKEIIFQEQSETGDHHVGDDEDDWRAVSWKTAKTSRSTASKFSKSSSTSIWMKGVGEEDSENNQDDDILFFDAIQDAEQMNNQPSTNAIDAPPTVITHQTNENSSSQGKIEAAEPKDQGGWTGKITSLVGYTLGALSGSKDEYDGKNDGADDTSGKTPDFSAAKTPRSSTNKSKSQSMASPMSPSKPVPSRELEIIKKCQALMKSQRSLLELREKESQRNLLEDIRLRRKEEAARARVWREVMAYREMMEGMGKGDKLAPLNSKDAAREYDDRLSMIKTLQEQEKKMKMHEVNMKQMEMRTNDKSGKDPRSCGCSCTIS